MSWKRGAYGHTGLAKMQKKQDILLFHIAILLFDYE